MAIDFALVRSDFAVAAAYKWLMCPYATGFLYVAPQHRDGEPMEEGWIIRKDSENFAGLGEYTDGRTCSNTRPYHRRKSKRPYSRICRQSLRGQRLIFCIPHDCSRNRSPEDFQLVPRWPGASGRMVWREKCLRLQELRRGLWAYS